MILTDKDFDAFGPNPARLLGSQPGDVISVTSVFGETDYKVLDNYDLESIERKAPYPPHCPKCKSLPEFIEVDGEMAFCLDPKCKFQWEWEPWHWEIGYDFI